VTVLTHSYFKLVSIFIRSHFISEAMARLVRREANGPMEIKVGNSSKWICMCGLSKNQPYCDGSHRTTLDEEEGKVYVYNSDGTRTEVNG